VLCVPPQQIQCRVWLSVGEERLHGAGIHDGMHMPHTGPNETHDVPKGQQASGAASEALL